MRLHRILFLLTVLCLGAAGCVSYSKEMAQYRMAYGVGDTSQAERLLKTWVQDDLEEVPSLYALPLLLESGSLAYADSDFTRSQRFFDAAEAEYERQHSKAKISVSREAVATLSNPATLPYRGSNTDILMLNAYQSLNLLAQGKRADARQPLVRLFEKQRYAVTDNAERIAETQQALKETGAMQDVKKTLESDALQNAYAELLKDLPDVRGYEPYVNPFATYLYGLYYLYAGVDEADRSTAETALKRVCAFAPENRTVRDDVARAAYGVKLPAGIYLIHERGLAPRRVERAFSFPIWTGSTNFMWVKFAFPKLEEDPNCDAFASFDLGEEHSATAELVCDMDAVLAQEYRDELPAILTRAVLSTTVKASLSAAASTVAKDRFGDIGDTVTSIGTAVWQQSTTIADTRSWLTLPKQIGVVRIDMPSDRTVTVACGAHRETLTLSDEGEVWVIHVRSMHEGSRPIIKRLRLR